MRTFWGRIFKLLDVPLPVFLPLFFSQSTFSRAFASHGRKLIEELENGKNHMLVKRRGRLCHVGQCYKVKRTEKGGEWDSGHCTFCFIFRKNRVKESRAFFRHIRPIPVSYPSKRHFGEIPVLHRACWGIKNNQQGGSLYLQGINT